MNVMVFFNILLTGGLIEKPGTLDRKAGKFTMDLIEKPGTLDRKAGKFTMDLIEKPGTLDRKAGNGSKKNQKTSARSP